MFRKLVTLACTGLFVFAVVGCAKPVDKADEPVEEIELEGVPGFDDPADTPETK